MSSMASCGMRVFKIVRELEQIISFLLGDVDDLTGAIADLL